MIKYFKLAIMRKKTRETWILYHEVKETQEHLVFGIFFFIYTDVKLLDINVILLGGLLICTTVFTFLYSLGVLTVFLLLINSLLTLRDTGEDFF